MIAVLARRRLVKRAFDQSAIVLMAGPFGDRQPLLASHAGWAKQHDAIDLLRVLTGIFDGNLAPQAAGDQVIRRRLDEFVEDIRPADLSGIRP